MSNPDEKEMMKNLDLLLNIEILQDESDWQNIENMDDADDTEQDEE